MLNGSMMEMYSLQLTVDKLLQLWIYNHIHVSKIAQNTLTEMVISCNYLSDKILPIYTFCGIMRKYFVWEGIIMNYRRPLDETKLVLL